MRAGAGEDPAGYVRKTNVFRNPNGALAKVVGCFRGRAGNYPGGSDLRSYHDFCPGSDVVDVFQTVTVLRSAAKVPGPWLMRSVETTVRTAASPSADQVER